MKAHMRKLLKIFTSRVVVVGLALLVQLSWYLLFLNRLANYSIVVNGFFPCAECDYSVISDPEG